MISTLVKVEDLAPLLGMKNPRHIHDTLRRNGVCPVERDGRRYLYDLEQVKGIPVWGSIMEAKKRDVNAIAIRRQRSDRGLPRKVDAAVLAHVVALTKDLFLSSAMPDVRNAAEAALRMTRADVVAGRLPISVEAIDAIRIEWLYKRWLMRKDDYMVGPVYAEGWQELHRQAWRQHEAALTGPYAARSTWKIFESAGWAGKGHGFGWMLVLDDRTADVWATTDDGLKMPNAIYVWDALTGALMWIEPTTEITTQAYVRAIVGAWWFNALERAPLVMLENAKAAKSIRIEDLLRSLYCRADIDRVYGDPNIRRLTNGEHGPVFRNLPHIARDFGKAAAERGFGIIKREHDASFSPTTFQGGDRSEAVQLHRNNQPWWFASLSHPRHDIARREEIPTVDDYFMSLYAWSQGAYLDRERNTLKQWAREHGLAPTRRAMVEYYGGRREAGVSIPSEQLCRVIYEASPRRRRAQCRAAGRVSVMVEGRIVNLISASITPDCVGRTVSAVPVPGSPREWILMLMMPSSQRVDRFVGICEDRTAETIEQAIEDRAFVRGVRQEIHAAIDSEVRESRTLSRPVEMQELPGGPAFVQELADADTADEVIEADVVVDDIDAVIDGDDGQHDDFDQIMNL